MNSQIKAAIVTALIAAGVVYAYHKGMLPGMKDSKTVKASV